MFTTHRFLWRSGGSALAHLWKTMLEKDDWLEGNQRGLIDRYSKW